MILAPEHPKGCPSETAPPFTFKIEGSMPSLFAFSIPTTEKASFSSQ